MSSVRDFSQATINENFNKALRSDLSIEDINNLRLYFEDALSEMSLQCSNENIELSRAALKSLSKTQSFQNIANAVDKSRGASDRGLFVRFWLIVSENKLISGLVVAVIMFYFKKSFSE